MHTKPPLLNNRHFTLVKYYAYTDYPLPVVNTVLYFTRTIHYPLPVVNTVLYFTRTIHYPLPVVNTVLYFNSLPFTSCKYCAFLQFTTLYQL